MGGGADLSRDSHSPRSLASDTRGDADRPASSPPADDDDCGLDDVAPRVAGYQVHDRLGAGGMGTVWRATQLSTRRAVALKLLSPAALASERGRRRFEREVELASQLEHPGIARIYDSGLLEGVCYYAMELVEGEHLDRHVAKHRLDLRRKLELWAAVCDAVHHAHQHGVIHRDLKPANILVDRQGRPKLLDFGVARATDADLQVTTFRTDVLQLVGTLAYMSPEQADGRPRDVDVRTDVYALGVIGYELLTGRAPHDLAGRSVPDALRAICHDEPSPISSIDRTLAGDLAAVVAAAMDKEKARRYASAAELAADVRRFLRHEPVTARAPSTWYQLRKFARRNRALVATVIGVMVALAAGVVATTTQMVRARAAEGVARQNERAALAERRAARQALTDSLVAQGDVLVSASRVVEARALFVRAASLYRDVGASDFPARVALWDADRQYPPADQSIRAHDERTVGVALWGETGTLALTTGLDHKAKVWDLRTGRLLTTFGEHLHEVQCGAFAPDGQLCITAGGDGLDNLYQQTAPNDCSVRIWDRSTGQQVATLVGHDKAVMALDVSADGRQLLTASLDGTVKLWDLAAGRLVRTYAIGAGAVHAVRFARAPDDGAPALACGTKDGAVRLVRLDDGATLRDLVGHRGLVTGLAVSRDGSTIVSCGGDKTVRAWDVRTGRERQALIGHRESVRQVALSPDGLTAYSASYDRTLRAWDLRDGAELRRFSGSASGAIAVAVSADGSRGLTGNWDGTLDVWDLDAAPPPRRLLGHEHFVRLAAFSRDGRLALTGSWDRTARIWDLATGKPLITLAGFRNYVVAGDFSPDGNVVAVGGNLRQVELWDLRAGRVVRSLNVSPRGTMALRFNRDGTRLLAAGKDGLVQLWDVSPGGADKPVLVCSGHADVVDAACFTPDEKHVLSGGHDRTLRLWDATTGACVRTFTGHTDVVSAVAVSPDGRTALSASWDGTVRQWDLATGRELRSLNGHQAGQKIAWSCAFLQGGTVAASGGQDGSIKLWDLTDGREIRALDAHRTQTYALSASPRGDALLSGGGDGVSLYWDLHSADDDAAMRRRSEAARAALAERPDDRAAMADLGKWYASRGAYGRALTSLDAGKQGEVAIDPLTLARCRWMAGQLDRADEAFRVAAERDRALADYVALCRAALSTPVVRRTPASPATRPAQR